MNDETIKKESVDIPISSNSSNSSYTTKQLFLIFSFVSSIIFLIYVILEYYGVIRLFSLLRKEKQIINNYKNLEKASDKKTTIAYSTKKDKLYDSSLKKSLLSILDQTVKVDDIVVFVVGDSKPCEYPEYINKIGNVVFVSDKDVKKQVFAKEREKNTKLVFLSDDYIYGKDFLQKFVEKSNNTNNTIPSNAENYTKDSVKFSDNVYLLDNASFNGDTNPDFDIIEYSENWRAF